MIIYYFYHVVFCVNIICMRKVSYCFLFVLLFSNIYAQQSKDIQWNPSNGMNFVEFLEIWEPGIPVSEDDNFPGEIKRAF